MTGTDWWAVGLSAMALFVIAIMGLFLVAASRPLGPARHRRPPRHRPEPEVADVPDSAVDSAAAADAPAEQAEQAEHRHSVSP